MMAGVETFGSHLDHASVRLLHVVQLVRRRVCMSIYAPLPQAQTVKEAKQLPFDIMS